MVEKLKGLFLNRILRRWGTKALRGYDLKDDKKSPHFV